MVAGDYELYNFMDMTNDEYVEEMPTINCLVCGGDGFTVEHDPRDESGRTPMQVQCDACHAEGRYATLDVVRTTLEEVRREERAETKNKFTQVIAGMPGRLFMLPHNVEKVVGYIREDGIGDIAYKGKEIDLMTVVNETLALTPTKTDKETIDEDCPEHGSSELAKDAFWERPWTAHWGCKCKGFIKTDKQTEV